MTTLRYSNMLSKICSYSFPRRSSCWRLLTAARSEFLGWELPAVRRCFSLSSESTESTEDTLPEELAEMRLRMSKLHNIASAKGVKLADYKRITNEEEEQDVSSCEFLKDDSEYDQLEDSSSQVKSSVESVEQGLRKHKDVDVLINMPYGYVRFDSMNRQKSTLQPVSEGSDVQDDLPSVKIVKDGQHVFSINAVEENEKKLKHGSEDIMRDETCHATIQKESHIHDLKPNVFDEQYFDDVLQQNDEKRRNVAKSTTVNSELCDPKPNVFEEQYFGDVLQHEEQKQTVTQQEEDKQRSLPKNTITDVRVCDQKPNLFDQQYFDDVLQHEQRKRTQITHNKVAKDAVRKSSQSTRSDHVKDTYKHNKLDDIENFSSHPKAASINDEELNLIDEQYFGSYAQSKYVSSQQAQEDDIGKALFSSSEQISHSQQDRHHSSAPDSRGRFQQHSEHITQSEIVARGHDSAPVWKEVEDMIKNSISDDDNTVVVEPVTRREMKVYTRPQADVENPKTAYDLSVKIRQERRQKQSTDRTQQTFGMNQFQINLHEQFDMYRKLV